MEARITAGVVSREDQGSARVVAEAAQEQSDQMVCRVREAQEARE